MSGICAVLGFILLIAWMLFRLVEVQSSRGGAHRVRGYAIRSAFRSVSRLEAVTDPWLGHDVTRGAFMRLKFFS